MAGPAWITGPWFLREERLYLMPGDSPMGLRLPLDSQPWAAKSDRPWTLAQDPFAPHAPLPSAAALRMQQAIKRGALGDLPEAGLDADAFTVNGDASSLAAGLVGNSAIAGGAISGGSSGVGSGVGLGASASGPGVDRMATEHDPVKPFPRNPLAVPARFESAGELTRTALCVEVRDPQRGNGPKAERAAEAKLGGRRGVLYIFMPPLKHLEDYLELLAAIEATTAELGLKIVIEGYGPPRDPRLKTLAVTPDPGVIEVNIHPAHSWAELVDHTEFLYDAAHLTRLSAEKFMLDGRHTGTGGGNHFVLGGATPADSPFLRRPDVLASLITYWHNHPALSYLFSGMFIGPTSQAPRFEIGRAHV